MDGSEKKFEFLKCIQISKNYLIVILKAYIKHDFLSTFDLHFNIGLFYLW